MTGRLPTLTESRILDRAFSVTRDPDRSRIAAFAKRDDVSRGAYLVLVGLANMSDADFADLDKMTRELL
jgi:hypothetical protein